MKPIDFIKIVIKDYKTIGAITLTSKQTIKRIVKEIKPEYKYIVEYGAGNGVITSEILKKIPSDGRVVAIEINEPLFKKLSELKDPRLTVLRGNIIDISENMQSLGLPRIDAVISGIPFSFLKAADRKNVLEKTAEALAPGGRFIIYQTSLLVLPKLKKLFKRTRYSLELRNIPPYFVMIAEK